MKHLRLYYQSPETVDNGLDDLTLADLVNSLNGGRPTLPCDGRNEDEPYATLPLLRWYDRGGPR